MLGVGVNHVTRETLSQGLSVRLCQPPDVPKFPLIRLLAPTPCLRRKNNFFGGEEIFMLPLARFIFTSHVAFIAHWYADLLRADST